VTDATALKHEVDRLAAYLARHRDVLVLTGAGLSTASGIPDYRDEQGVRRGKAPVQGPEFRQSDAVRKRYWARSMVGWPTLATAAPNAGHRALAQLEADGRIASVITQNVDGLHQRAGSSRVTELHGNIHAVVCLDCHAQFSRAFVQSLLEQANSGLAGAIAHPAPDGDAHIEPDALAEFHVPHCIHCAGMLKPDVVFFGDGVPSACTEAAFASLAQADAVLVVGSSLMVFSGFRLCRMAAESGKPIAAVNRGKTRADHLLSLKIEESAELVLPAARSQLSYLAPANR
jgi:NAD-dependent SIR2 family protein deacetylase